MSFDHSQIYIKFVNESWTHHGYKYKLGLNIDPIELDTFNGDCTPGGFYFSDMVNFKMWSLYGDNIALITIPFDAKIHAEAYKWKSDRINIVDIFPKEEVSTRLLELFPEIFEPRPSDTGSTGGDTGSTGGNTGSTPGDTGV